MVSFRVHVFLVLTTPNLFYWPVARKVGKLVSITTKKKVPLKSIKISEMKGQCVYFMGLHLKNYLSQQKDWK